MRFEGKLTERWGRKASGLRDSSAYDSGVAGANLKPSSGRGLCAGARLFDAAYPKRRVAHASTTWDPRLQRYLDNAPHKSLSASAGSPGPGICGENASDSRILPIRETSHVQFNFVLLYS